MATDGSISAFAAKFQEVLDSGIGEPINVLAGGKACKEPKAHGLHGIEITSAWCKQVVARGIPYDLGLRLAPGYVAFDIDTYEKDGQLKEGWQDFVKYVCKGSEVRAQQLWSTAIMVASRGLGMEKRSGTLIFRAPLDIIATLPGEFGAVDIRRAKFGYIVVAGTNPDAGGARYQIGRGGVELDHFPTAADVTALPEWACQNIRAAFPAVSGGGIGGSGEVAPAGTSGHGKDWLLSLSTDEVPCGKVRAAADTCVANVEVEPSRYPTMVSATYALVLLCWEGHRGVGTALGKVWLAYKDRVSDEPTRQWQQEFFRAVSGAVHKAESMLGLPDSSCTCYGEAMTESDWLGLEAMAEALGGSEVLAGALVASEVGGSAADAPVPPPAVARAAAAPGKPAGGGSGGEPIGLVDTVAAQQQEEEPAGSSSGPLMPVLPESFWDTDVLRHIRDGADHFGAQRGGVLGAVMGLWALDIPLDVLTPHGPINPFIALTGISRSGKTWAYNVARKLYPARVAACWCGDAGHEPNYAQVDLGSPEGLIDQYFDDVGPDPKSLVNKRDRDSVVFYVDEGTLLSELAGRSGAGHLLSLLRQAWSGERLAFGWKTKGLKQRVEAGTYRMVMVVGLQPMNAGFLLGETAGGLTQRFLWVGCQGDAYVGELGVTWPGKLPRFEDQFAGLQFSDTYGTPERLIPVAEDVRREARELVLPVRTTLDPTYVVAPEANVDLRYQLAALLARGHGQLGGEGISRRWWDKAAVLLQHAAGVVAACEWAVPVGARRLNAPRVQNAVDTAVAIREALSASGDAAKAVSAVDKAARKILKFLEGWAPGHGPSRADVRRAMGGDKGSRDVCYDVLDRLVSLGKVERRVAAGNGNEKVTFHLASIDGLGVTERG